MSVKLLTVWGAALGVAICAVTTAILTGESGILFAGLGAFMTAYATWDLRS